MQKRCGALLGPAPFLHHTLLYSAALKVVADAAAKVLVVDMFPMDLEKVGGLFGMAAGAERKVVVGSLRRITQLLEFYPAGVGVAGTAGEGIFFRRYLVIKRKVTRGSGKLIPGVRPTHRKDSLPDGLIHIARLPHDPGFDGNEARSALIIRHLGPVKLEGIDLGLGVANVPQGTRQHEGPYWAECEGVAELIEVGRTVEELVNGGQIYSLGPDRFVSVGGQVWC